MGMFDYTQSIGWNGIHESESNKIDNGWKTDLKIDFKIKWVNHLTT